MPVCDSCDSDRILRLGIKCSDRCLTTFKGVTKDGYAPDIEGLCGGDYVRPSICLECGKTQGTFPKEDPEGFKELACIECGHKPTDQLYATAADECGQDGCLGYYDYVVPS